MTLRVPLQIYEPGTDKRSLLEESHSVKVSLWGGLIALKSAIKQAQGLVLTNQAAGETKEAQVVYLRAMHLGRRPVAIEFLEPSPGGGPRQQVTKFPESGLFIEEPKLSPDGRWLAYCRNNGGSSLWLLELGTTQQTAL